MNSAASRGHVYNEPTPTFVIEIEIEAVTQWLMATE